RVQERMLRNGLMERCVEHGHLRHSRTERGACGFDASQIRRIVQRCEIDVFLNAALDFRIDEHGTLEPLAPMHHAVSDRVDLGHAPDGNSGALAREPREQEVHGGAMVAKRQRTTPRYAVARGEVVDRLATYALHESASELLV